MNKKEQVIETARTLFSSYGYKKVSMDEIAKQSNVTKKTIYTYFKDKNELIKYFLYEELEHMKTLVDEIDKKNYTFEEKIYNVLITLMEYRYNSSLLNAFTKENGTLADECSTILNEAILKEIKIKLEEAIKQKYIKPCDPEITSFIIYKIYLALMFEWNKPFNHKEAIDKIMSILKSGLFNQGGI